MSVWTSNIEVIDSHFQNMLKMKHVYTFNLSKCEMMILGNEYKQLQTTKYTTTSMKSELILHYTVRKV